MLLNRLSRNPEKNKRKRRFRCYVPGFVPLPIRGPSRRWVVLTEEEEQELELEQSDSKARDAWERVRDAQSAWDLLRKW